MTPNRWIATTALVLGLANATPLRAQTSAFDLASLELPPGFLELSNLTILGPRPGAVVATATTTLMGNITNALVSTFTTPGNKRGLILALKPKDWSLTRTIPALENPILDELTFEYVGLVLSNEEMTLSSASLSSEERAFYRDIYQSDNFTLTVKPGINLIAAIPAESLKDDHPLTVVMDALGIEKGVVLIQGTLGKSLSLIGAPGAGGLDIIKDLYLRAELPPMRPPGSPEWFHSGQLALEITGLPSLRLVGEINVGIQQDSLQFFLAASLARTGMTLSGGLQADADGWVAPFGIPWLTLNKVVLMLGVTPVGSVQLGFAGDAVFGEKDIAVAVAIAISPAGAPTNFILEGESEAGLALSDLATVQEGMAKAAGREGPRLPIDALPNVALTHLGIKFAPKPQPELGVERGMAIKGRLWLQTSPNGELTDFAGVDVNVGEDGLWVRGDIGAFSLGPLSLDDTRIDLTATPEEQYFLLKGGVDLLGASQQLDIELSRTGFHFYSNTVLWNLFSAQLAAEAAFNLTNPAFRLHAEMDNNFGQVLGPTLIGGLANFAAHGQDILADLDTILQRADAILSNREADLETIRAELAALQAEADRLWQMAQQAVDAMRRNAAATRRAANAAYNSYASTGWRYPMVRAAYHAQWLALEARYRVQSATATGLAAAATARQRIREALPPIEDSILMRGAAAALAAARDRAQTARNNLGRLQQRYALIVEHLENATLPLTIERATFDSDLQNIMAGQAASWSIAGTFLGSAFLVQRDIDFSNLIDGASTFVAELIR